MKRVSFFPYAIGLALLDIFLCIFVVGAIPQATPEITLPNKSGTIKFLAIGDTGTGGGPQQQIADVIVKARAVFPFDFAIMMGDNMYGGEDANDYATKFEIPYKRLLDGGVKFYASLGNHDNPTQRMYKNFNMDGKEYYTFKKGNIRFFALNSNYMDKRQLDWLQAELEKSGSDWKICYFHHPIYSSGRMHGPTVELQKVVEPVFIKNQVNIVLTGHEHFYERIKPQKGIYYFITGAGGKISNNDIKKTNLTEKAFDQEQHFMLFEGNGDEMHFQTISKSGKTIDSGVIPRLTAPRAAADAR